MTLSLLEQPLPQPGGSRIVGRALPVDEVVGVARVDLVCERLHQAPGLQLVFDERNDTKTYTAAGQRRATGDAVTQPGELAQALTAALEDQQAAVIHVRIDPAALSTLRKDLFSKPAGAGT